MSDALHTAWAKLLMGALESAGVKQVVVSPGSRSTALALAAEQNAKLTVTPVIDERSSAFFALGQARITGFPTVLVCTSGSAGAHYLPAVIEAAQSGCPLVVITADRPPELHDCFSNQTIPQRGLFGAYPRAEFDLGVPDLEALPSVARYAAQAVAAALSPEPGPVHINAPFRKPLEPTPLPAHAADVARGSARTAAADQRARALLERPHRWFPPALEASGAAVQALVTRLEAARRPLIVAGPLLPPAGVPRVDAMARLSRSVFNLARAVGAAVFAEGTSGIQPGMDASDASDVRDVSEAASPRVPVLRNFEALAGVAAGAHDELSRPDLIVEIGAPAVSASYAAHLCAHQGTARITVATAGTPNPTNTATTLIHGDAARLFERARMSSELTTQTRSEWFDKVADLARLQDRFASEACEDVGDGEDPKGVTEARVAHELTRALPLGSSLLVGNSLAVRDLDLFGGAFEHSVTVVHQRGASGIDGLIATTAGVRSVTPSDAAVLGWIGDVSALHDVGSLALLSPSRTRARVNAPLVLLVVNNGGGRIFAELPLAKLSSSDVPGIDEAMGELFFTPPGDFLSGVAQGFGIAYECITERASLRPALDAALNENRATVIEVMVPPEDGARRRAKFRARLAEALRASGIAKSASGPESGPERAPESGREDS